MRWPVLTKLGVRLRCAVMMTLQSVRFEAKRYSVVAPTLASRLWTILEHVSLVSSAAGTVVFGSHHEELAISLRLHDAGKAGVETWPAGTAVEFHVRGKQRLATAGTHISTLAFFIVQRVGEGPLGTLVAQDLVLIRVQYGAPLGVRAIDLVHRLAASDERHLGGHDGEKLNVGLQRQAGHVQ